MFLLPDKIDKVAVLPNGGQRMLVKTEANELYYVVRDLQGYGFSKRKYASNIWINIELKQGS